MSTPQPDRFTVQARYEEEVMADRAEFQIVIAGQSFFSGREALARAEEVAEVVGMLREFGIADEDVALRDVAAESQKGVLTDSSSARYTLRATCRELDKVADIMVAVTRPKHTHLSYVRWLFPDDAESEDQRLARAVERANTKGEIMARILGVRIEGVCHATFDEDGDQMPQPMALGGIARRSSRSASTVSETIDMEVERTRTQGVTVRVEFRVSGRSPS